MTSSRNRRTNFHELKEVFRILQGPQGCPWDKKQTHASLLKYLREESREFAEAVKSGNDRHMEEELGDVLLQVMFHARIAERQGRFSIEDVIRVLIKKLKRRHPHVFGNLKVKSARQVIVNWNKIKAREKKTH